MVRRHNHCCELLSWVEGSKTMPSGGKVDGTCSGLTRNAGTGLTATNNPRQIGMLQPGTCYARPIYPQNKYFEVLAIFTR